MDALYLYRHAHSGGAELRYSLRSIERHAPYIRKVWIFGDKPDFIANDLNVIEHIPHEVLATLLHIETPIRNFFLMMLASSLIPELAPEYLRFSDDFILTSDLSIHQARQVRYVENLVEDGARRDDAWGKSLWRTCEVLQHFGYPTLNFESHVPFHLTRRRVLAAYLAFRHFVTEDAMYGMIGATAILNHAVRHEGLQPVDLHKEESRFGFWSHPPAYNEVITASQGKIFMNFDDAAFGDGILQFLQERFPSPSKYELK
jgi:hypothetical protein